MNHAKIATIYEAVAYPSLMLLMATGDMTTLAPYNRLAWRVGILLADENPEMTQPEGWTYGISFKNIDDETVRFDAQGAQIYDEHITLSLRAYNWAHTQMPAEDCSSTASTVRATGQDVHSAFLSKYKPSRSTAKSEHKIVFASEADLAVLARGCRAFQRKQNKAVKKVLAQLATYHQEQVAAKAAETLAQLRLGYWLGADLALTTAPRVNEPGVPFMGDVADKPSGLAYWPVKENGGMDTHFPAGTGLALRPINRSRDLVDGAVYVWNWAWGAGPGDFTTIIGRCDLSAKTRGFLPIRHEDGTLMPMCWLNWGSSEIKVYRVTHYTTRAEQLTPAMVAETQPARPALRSNKKRALQAAA